MGGDAAPLRAKAARGVLWTLAEYGGGEAISFVVFLVIARMVAPADFGVVSLALVIVSLVQLVLNQGFADAVIQRETLEPGHADTAFWANVAIAALFLPVLLLGADLAAAAFGEPRLAPVLRALSPLPLATALVSIHNAMFRRRLDFASFAKRAFVATGLGGLVGIALALSGAGVWSLVGQQLTNAIASIAVLWRASAWRPGLRVERARVAELAPFAGAVIGSNLVAFAWRRIDVVAIGWVWGAHELGYYYLAQRLFLTLGLVTQAAIQSIVMPVLARVQGDPDRFRDIYARTVELLNAVWLPLALGAGLVAAVAVPLLFGAKWQPAVPLCEILALAGFVDAWTLYAGPALTAAGRPGAVLRLSLAQSGIAILVVPAATLLGTRGTAAAVVATGALMIAPTLALLSRVAAIRPAELLRRCAGPIGAGIAMAAVVLALRTALDGALPAPALLALLVAAGAATYLGAAALLAPALLREIAGLLAAVLPGRRAISLEP